jgi:hypothetical protein
MSAQRERQPWPMKWVVLAILAVIVPYTFLTLHFRKPGKAYEPYHDMKERANTIRLLAAGFQRISLEAERPADAGRASALAPVRSAPGGVPPMLKETILDQPLLPDEIVRVAAPPTANTLMGYALDVTCTEPDNHHQLAGASAYVHGDEIYITPEFERLGGELLARTRETTARLTFPAGELKPGDYRVTLLGAKSSQSWTLEVR